MGTSRYVFNETVKYLQQPDTKANWKAIKTEIIRYLPDWAKEIPYQIKSMAIKDACTAVRLAKKKYKKTGKIQKVKFRSRRDKIQSCYIPKSAVSNKGIYQMYIKKSRKIRAKCVRQMLTLSHYRFKQFLKHKAFEAGKTVLDVNEAYTSKTISWTGEIIHNLGGRKTIKDNSGFVMDRDLNGGRGIFLRSLVDIPSLKNCIVNIS